MVFDAVEEEGDQETHKGKDRRRVREEQEGGGRLERRTASRVEEGRGDGAGEQGRKSTRWDRDGVEEREKDRDKERGRRDDGDRKGRRDEYERDRDRGGGKDKHMDQDKDRGRKRDGRDDRFVEEQHRSRKR